MFCFLESSEVLCWDFLSPGASPAIPHADNSLKTRAVAIRFFRILRFRDLKCRPLPTCVLQMAATAVCLHRRFELESSKCAHGKCEHRLTRNADAICRSQSPSGLYATPTSHKIVFMGLIH